MKKGTYEYEVLQKNPVTDRMKAVAKKHNVRTHICLFTRFGACETVMVLVGAITPPMTDSFGLKKPQFNYRFFPAYAYGITGDRNKAGGVISVDFSTGPTLRLGDIIPGTELKVVEIDVDSNIVATEKAAYCD